MSVCWPRVASSIISLSYHARLKDLLKHKLKDARKEKQRKFDEYATGLNIDYCAAYVEYAEDLEGRAEDEARLKEMRKSEDLVELPESRPSLPKKEDIADVTDQKEVKLTSAAGVPRMPPVCGQAEVASDAISESQPLD